MQGKTILISGGAGLIGSWIAELLVREGAAEIRILDNFSRGTKNNLACAAAKGPLVIIEGDTRDPDVVARAMDGVDTVFEQSAIRITQCAAEPDQAMEIMANGTYNLIKTAVRAGVRKFVAASSASVYGLAEEFPTAENHHPYDNRTLYGALKVFYEGLLRSFNDMYDLNYVALRYFNVYGPRMDIHGKYTEVLIRWMERIVSGNPPLIFGDGTQTMDFVYIEDVARANIMAAKSQACDAVFNIASGVETSLNDLAHALLRVMNSDLAPEYGPPRAVNPVSRRLADTRAAQKQLDFTASVPLEEGLRRLVAWWKQENRLS